MRVLVQKNEMGSSFVNTHISGVMYVIIHFLMTSSPIATTPPADLLKPKFHFIYSILNPLKWKPLDSKVDLQNLRKISSIKNINKVHPLVNV